MQLRLAEPGAAHRGAAGGSVKAQLRAQSFCCNEFSVRRVFFTSSLLSHNITRDRMYRQSATFRCRGSFEVLMKVREAITGHRYQLIVIPASAFAQVPKVMIRAAL